MRKLTATALAIVLTLSLAACGGETSTSASVSVKEEPIETSTEVETETEVEIGSVGMANPYEDMGSLEALNDAFMIALSRPSVMGVTEESFNKINGDTPIAQYQFKVNEATYTYRSASTTEDISGVYVGDGTLFSSVGDGEEAIVEADGFRGARWFHVDGQYCLVTDAEAVDAETFEAIVDEFKSVTAKGYMGPSSETNEPSEEFAAIAAVLDPLSGEYQDSTSGRAHLSFVSYGSVAEITVEWGDSASTTYRWNFKSVELQDGKLVYTGGEYWKVTAGSDGEYEEELLDMGLEGYFEISEDGLKLLWTGAKEDNQKECVFEKMPEV